MITRIFEKIYRNIISIPINFKCLPFKQAVKLPIHVSGNIAFGNICKKSVEIKTPIIYRGMIQLGTNKGSFDMGGVDYVDIKQGGKIIFYGPCNICSGIKISIGSKAKLEIGENTFINSNTIIAVCSSVFLGRNFSAGWNCMITDWDGHDIIDSCTLKLLNTPAPISFGEDCWIGAHTTVLKGCTFANKVIVPCSSIVTKSCSTESVIFGGTQNKILKSHVYRKYE